MVLKLPQDHEDSEYMLKFEIGQREGGFYSTRTDTQTDRRTDTPSTVFVYRWGVEGQAPHQKENIHFF